MSNGDLMGAAESKVWDWAYRNGELPTDEEFVEALRDIANSWLQQRHCGMDVVASALRDNLAEIAKLMEDLH